MCIYSKTYSYFLIRCENIMNILICYVGRGRTQYCLNVQIGQPIIAAVPNSILYYTHNWWFLKLYIVKNIFKVLF